MEVEGDAHEGCPCKAFTALRKSPPHAQIERETVKKVSWWKKKRRYFRSVTVCLFSSLVASPISHTSLSLRIDPAMGSFVESGWQVPHISILLPVSDSLVLID